MYGYITARDGEGRAIYHTNVMMAVGTSAAVVCVEAVTVGLALFTTLFCSQNTCN